MELWDVFCRVPQPLVFRWNFVCNIGKKLSGLEVEQLSSSVMLSLATKYIMIRLHINSLNPLERNQVCEVNYFLIMEFPFNVGCYDES